MEQQRRAASALRDDIWCDKGTCVPYSREGGPRGEAPQHHVWVHGGLEGAAALGEPGRRAARVERSGMLVRLRLGAGCSLRPRSGSTRRAANDGTTCVTTDHHA